MAVGYLRLPAGPRRAGDGASRTAYGGKLAGVGDLEIWRPDPGPTPQPAPPSAADNITYTFFPRSPTLKSHRCTSGSWPVYRSMSLTTD